MHARACKLLAIADFNIKLWLLWEVTTQLHQSHTNN